MLTLQQELERLLRDTYSNLNIRGNDTGPAYHATFRELALRHIFAILPVRRLHLTNFHEIHVEAPNLATSFVRRYDADIWPDGDMSEGTELRRALVGYFLLLLQTDAQAQGEPLLDSLAPKGRRRTMSVPPTTRPQWPDLKAHEAECVALALGSMSIGEPPEVVQEGEDEDEDEEDEGLAEPASAAAADVASSSQLDPGVIEGWRYCRVPVSFTGSGEQCGQTFRTDAELAKHQKEIHDFDDIYHG
ncbi:hypothetical protein LTR85_001840 [Meristemomyces frigidus]|nr:hypothetical protein LTR85_001840 [Meristemomyces frigidus]